MILGIMSDSHGDLAALRQAADAVGTVDLWLHAGDYCEDAAFLAEYTQARTVGVAGNCDGLAARLPQEEYVELLGLRLLLTHGHGHGVKRGTDELVAWARHMEAAVVVYGHTHIPEISRAGDLWIVNPGSVARPRLSGPTAVRAVVVKGIFSAELVEFC